MKYIEKYERVRIKEPLELSGGILHGPKRMVEIIRQAERPEPVDWENPPPTGGLPNMYAPLVYQEFDGSAWWLGTRPMRQVVMGRNGQRSGYASAEGKQRKFVESEIYPAEGGSIPVWICCERHANSAKIFRLPWPLETHADALKWQEEGLTLAKSPQHWEKFLVWRGLGSAPAIQAVRERWKDLMGSRDAVPKKWPGDVRIVSPKPGEMAAATRSWDEVCEEIENLKAAEKARLSGVNSVLEAVRGDIAKLRQDLEMEKTRRANLEDRVIKLAREVAGLRALV